MSAVSGVAINVASYPIVLALGWFSQLVWTRWKLRGDRKLWEPFLGGGDLAVILTDKPGRKTPKVSVTEVEAFSDLRSVLNSLGKEIELQIGNAANYAVLRNRRFVCLGGPVANPITKLILDGLHNLPVRYDPTLIGFKTANGGPYIEVVAKDGTGTVTDYGLIVKLSKVNPKATDSCPALIVFGLRGAGTQDAVRAILTDAPVREFMSKNREANYYALLRFSKNNASDPCEIESSGTF